MHPENLVKPCLKNYSGEFHPILVTDVFGLVDVLIRFWGQKVKVTAGNDAKTLRTSYLKNHTNEGNSTQFWSWVYLVIDRSNSKITASGGIP